MKVVALKILSFNFCTNRMRRTRTLFSEIGYLGKYRVRKDALLDNWILSVELALKTCFVALMKTWGLCFCATHAAFETGLVHRACFLFPSSLAWFEWNGP